LISRKKKLHALLIMITLCNGDEEQIDLNKLRQLYMLMTSSRRRHKPDIGHKPTTDAI
jgi:hypothetical protein